MPWTKHIYVKFHHFRDYVDRGEITLHAIGTADQPADMLTKPLAEPILSQHRHTIMGWGGKGNAERECEDSYLRGVQQCHEPAGDYPSTKSTRRPRTRSPRKVTFDQSRPTTTRQDLNNFSA